MNLESLLAKSLKTGDLSFDEIVFLLSLSEPYEIKQLLATADTVRHECVGDGVYIRGLLEFSNICARQCLYCGLRCDNPEINRYRMPIDEIIETSIRITKKGITTIVLQSGEDAWFTADKMAEIISGIKSKADCAITLSIGERSYDEYKIMKDAGADRFLLRHETANPELYSRLHPESKFEDRVRCLRDLKKLGYQVGAGCMVGLPGQTIEDMAKDAMFVRDIEADMVGVGPFIPHPNTPIGECEGGTLDMTLKMVAMMRITTRNAHLPATTAVGSIDPIGREKALQAGANIVMPNYTPLKYRVDYEIYPNKRCINEDPELCDGCMRARIESIGRHVAKGYGHSYKL